MSANPTLQNWELLHMHCESRVSKLKLILFWDTNHRCADKKAPAVQVGDHNHMGLPLEMFTFVNIVRR